jgi:hypothetical protein
VSALQVGLVLLGILTRGSGSGGGKAGDNGAPAGQNLGYIAILGAALGYACLGRAFRWGLHEWKQVHNSTGMTAHIGPCKCDVDVCELLLLSRCWHKGVARAAMRVALTVPAVPAGVVYDYMMRVESPPPSHSQVMDLGSRIGAHCRVWHASPDHGRSGDVQNKHCGRQEKCYQADPRHKLWNAAGLAVSTVYQVGYTLPRYQQLVGSHLQRGGISPVAALAALAAFGVVIVTHTFVQVCAVCALQLQAAASSCCISASILQPSRRNMRAKGQHGRRLTRQLMPAQIKLARTTGLGAPVGGRHGGGPGQRGELRHRGGGRQPAVLRPGGALAVPHPPQGKVSIQHN